MAIAVLYGMKAPKRTPKPASLPLSGVLFGVTMRLDKKFTTLWVKKITGTQLFFENECSIIS